jgi:hypothetical protein
VLLTPLSCPGDGPMDGKPTVYLCIAALEANVLNCRCWRAGSGLVILPMSGARAGM